MLLLSCRVGLRHDRPRLAQPKAQLPEETLALPHSQVDAIALGDPGCQGFAIPQVDTQPQFSRRPTKGLIDLLQLFLVEAPRPPGSLSSAQAGETALLEPAHPILHRARSIPQQLGDLRARHALSHQQHPIQAVVIAGFLGPSDLILQSEDDCCRIGNRERSHVSMRAYLHHYTQLFMSLCF